MADVIIAVPQVGGDEQEARRAERAELTLGKTGGSYVR